MSIGQELLNAPFPQMVRDLGVGIAQAQFELDKVSMSITRFMAGLDADGAEDANNEIKIGSQTHNLLSLGFTPTFYQFVDTVIELKISMSMNTESSTKVASFKGKAGFMSVAMVGAAYSQKYQYSAEGSSLMRTKLVTVPTPSILEELIRSEYLAEDTGS